MQTSYLRRPVLPRRHRLMGLHVPGDDVGADPYGPLQFYRHPIQSASSWFLPGLLILGIYLVARSTV
jgi:hypothetical protein